MPLLLGCIADDFTGATDLAGMLVKGGMRTVQTIGTPPADEPPPDAEAVVIALKSRTVPAEEAVARSLEALDWLRARGARQIYFKYCSTFDSTDRGNIGPVAEALADRLEARSVLFCPAFPANGRVVFKGHLFAGDVLLNESGMQDHPLTPMTDPNLVRVLARQSRSGVGLVDYRAVRTGPDAVRAALAGLAADGKRFAIADATDEDDLVTLGAALPDAPLLTGGSGLAMGLPANFDIEGLLPATGSAAELPAVGGAAAVLSGSCSRATNAQVQRFAAQHPSFRIDPRALAQGRDLAAEALAWAQPRLAEGPVLIYATAEPDEVRAVQAELGAERAGALVEEAMATIARGLVEAGVRRLVVAGGETSGAVVAGLGVRALRIGLEIAPGVPWTAALSEHSLGEQPLALALKSGNFGGEDFFAEALALQA